MSIIYRTSGAWGAGKGANLTAAEIDENFHGLDTRVQEIEANPIQPVQIEDITSTGATITIHMDDGSTFGPLTLPVALFVFRGAWTPSTAYNKNDVVMVAGNSYLVMTGHTSGTTFDENLIVLGLTAYRLLFRAMTLAGAWAPSTSYKANNIVTASGAVYIVLADHTSGTVFDPAAASTGGMSLYGLLVEAPMSTIGISVSGLPEGGMKIVLPFTKALTLPVDGLGSVIVAATTPTADVSVTGKLNGAGSAVLTVDWLAGAMTGSVSNAAAVSFAAGDFLLLEFPATADATLADVGIALKFVVP